MGFLPAPGPGATGRAACPDLPKPSPPRPCSLWGRGRVSLQQTAVGRRCPERTGTVSCLQGHCGCSPTASWPHQNHSFRNMI